MGAEPPQKTKIIEKNVKNLIKPLLKGRLSDQHPSATHARGLVVLCAEVACFSRTSPPSTPHIGAPSCTVISTEKLNSTPRALDNGR